MRARRGGDLPSELERAIELQRRGDLTAAAAIYRSLLAREPRNADALHYLGLAARQSGDVRGAEGLLRRTLELAPERVNALCDLATLCAERQNFEEAIPLFRRALALDSNHTDALYNLGNTLRKVTRPHEALSLFQRLTRIRPNSGAAFRRLADTHYRLGDVDATLAAYRRALEIDPDDKLARVNLGDAYESAGRFRQARFHYASVLRRDLNSPLALAGALQLRDQNVEAEWIEAAQSLASSATTSLDARIRLNVALGHYYDRQRDYERAFSFLHAGNAMQFARQPYDSTLFTAAVDRLIEVFTTELFARLPRADAPGGERPLFIVGMPRSGTTLTEQILASHSQVVGGGELSVLLGLGRQIPTYPHDVRDLDAEALRGLAAQYLEWLNSVSASSPRVTDKLPFNFLHIGLIALLFPKASIVHCRRDPVDNSLSCFFTGFADQIQFANDLATIGRYYVDYSRLMQHWHAVLPGRIFDLQYEELVADTESRVRALVAHCGLEWEDACLAFHRTERGVRTPSRWQVRQPMYGTSIARWKRYEKHLEPLLKVLDSRS